MRAFAQFRELMEMIKFSHSLFALPFALTATLLAAHGFPPLRVMALIIACMVTARTAAMTFNRIVDRRFDAANPRTKERALPAGRVSLAAAWTLLIVSAVLFVAAASAINRATMILAPIALVIVLSYSLAKRFTAAAHYLLGLALGVAPVGAWLAVRGTLDPRIFLLSLAVMLWTAGFDLLYACQDAAFDRATGLHSIPAKLGIPSALRMARLSHALAVTALVAFGLALGLSWPWFLGTGVAAALLLGSHLMVRSHDLSRLQFAFFQVNVGVGLAVLAGAAGSVFRA